MTSVQALIDFANNSIYPMQGLLALLGVFNLILVFRRIQVKRFRSIAAAQAFNAELRGLLETRNYEGAAQLCDSPPYWSKAAAQLGLIAFQNTQRDAASLRRTLAERFEREVMAEMDYRMSWVSTAIKGEPMLGLLGTVLGMISAFSHISQATKQGNAAETLAQDISFALITTAVGLIIAIPLMMAANVVQIRMARLQDEVQQSMQDFLEAFEQSRSKTRGRV